MFESNPLLYKQQYRIPSTRYQGWFYGWDGCYYVTICTRDKHCYFGEVVDGHVRLSPIGKLVKEEWLKTPSLRPYVSLDEFMIMPNHLHIIFMIDHSTCCGTGRTANKGDARGASLRDEHQRDNRADYHNVFGPQRHNLSSIIRGFKSAATARARSELSDADFAWQPRFHDRIIRTERGLEKVRLYIRRNPEMWGDDEYYV